MHDDHQFAKTKIYRFAPIETKQEFDRAVRYVAKHVEHLSMQIVGSQLPMGLLTIFAHYEEEFLYLKELAEELGEIEPANNGIAVLLHEPVTVTLGDISRIRIRKPDPYRMQVGYCDLVVDDYEQFKELYVPEHPDNLRLIDRPDYEMIEFFDPDFDVLAYVVS